MVYAHGMSGLKPRKHRWCKRRSSTLREWERELIGKQEQLHEEEQKLNEREELINNRFETLKQSEKGLEVTCAMLERDQAVLEQSETELISRTVVVTDREEVLFLTPFPFLDSYRFSSRYWHFT
jgi:uncharacterized protein (DUF3084 family)